MLAAAIILAMVLYLIDRNGQWPKFWRVLKFGAIGILLIAGGLLGVVEWSDHQMAMKNARYHCAQTIRARYPGAYDDMDDATLVTKAEIKDPKYCDTVK